MRVGVPKEIKVEEYRVGLTPASVREYVAHGHEVVVQRGAGDGIGRACALACAAHGATVVLLGRTLAKLEAVYDEIDAISAKRHAYDPNIVAHGGVFVVLHYDGTPITARFIANAIGDHQDHLKVTPLRKAVT